jgi:hypothetical protein
MNWQKLLLCVISSLFTINTNAASNFRLVCIEKDQDVLVADGDRDLLVIELNELMNVGSDELERLFYRDLVTDFRLTRYRGVQPSTDDQSLSSLALSLNRSQQRRQPLVASDEIGGGFVTLRFEDRQSETPENERFIRFNSAFVRNQMDSTSMATLEFSSRSFNRPFASAQSTRFYTCSSPEFYEVSFGDGDQSQPSESDIDAQF